MIREQVDEEFVGLFGFLVVAVAFIGLSQSEIAVTQIADGIVIVDDTVVRILV